MLLKKDQIDALALCASKDETRPALNGIHLSPRYAEATDGHVLLRVFVEGVVGTAEYPKIEGFSGPTMPKERGKVIVPTKAMREAGRGIKKHRSLPILESLAIDARGADKSITMATTDMVNPKVTTSPTIEGPFPNTDKVIPDSRPDIRIAFNPHVLGLVIDAAKKLGSEYIVLETHGDIGAMSCGIREGVKGPFIAFALAMPMRLSEAGTTIPTEPRR